MIYFCESFITIENTLYFIESEEKAHIVVIGAFDAYKLLTEIKEYRNLNFSLTFISFYTKKTNKRRILFNIYFVGVIFYNVNSINIFIR